MVVAAGVELSREGDASDENDDAEFFDAMEDSPAFITVTASGNIQHKWDFVFIKRNLRAGLDFIYCMLVSLRRSGSNQSMMSSGLPNDWTQNEDVGPQHNTFH